jgi:hypothetical protein
MKKNIALFFVLQLFYTHFIIGQIGINGNPDASAALDVISNTKGLLTPRMNTAFRDAIPAPATGLQIFNTTTNYLEFFVNGLWQPIACG